LTTQNYLLFAALTGGICALAISNLKKVLLFLPAGMLAGICSAGAAVGYLYFREKVHTVELFLPVLIGVFPVGILFGFFDELFYGKKETE
jgi:membrane associated rhomboid family serine protease